MVYATTTESKSEEHPGKKGEPCEAPLIMQCYKPYSVYPGFCCSSG